MASIYQTYTPPSSDGGGFLKIKDGETITMRIASEPVIFQSEYQGKLSTRYGWAIWNNNEESAQIFTNSATFFRQLAAYDADEDYGDIKGYNIKVSRQGEGTDTKYTIVPSPKKSELTSEQKSEVAKIDIIKAISAGAGVSQVHWLADFVNGAVSKPVTIEGVGGKAKKPIEITEEFGDEPVDLNDIPF